ncbi:MAG: adenosine deaminase [Vampirovibrionales bacterium]|nr:adenosine deaminase [Vampirovibrionales bacterium]
MTTSVDMTAVSIPSDISRKIERMPKMEIHVHLEGATDPETVFKLAQKNKIPLPAKTLEDWRAFFKFKNFPHFIEVYTSSCTAFQTLEDWAYLSETFLKNQAAQNIRYSEVFLSTSHHLKKFPKRDFLDALMAGAKAGEEKYGSKMKLIADVSREMPDTRHDVLEFALMGKDAGFVIGLGLGGLEKEFPPRLFSDIYSEADKQGLHNVAHAGEAAGPESIAEAIEKLAIKRIGHGVRVLEDSSLVKTLAESKIPFEVNPISNYRLGIVPKEAPHPIHQMLANGLYCTVNSDDPTMFDTSLSNEYKVLASQGMDWEALWQLNLNTLEATFLSDAEKSAYRKEWKAFTE